MMIRQLSKCHVLPGSAPVRWVLFAGLLVLAAVGHSPSLRADQRDNLARCQMIDAPRGEIAWISGGVGEEDRARMRQGAADYNVHLLFNDRQGGYLAEVPFAVTPTRGTQAWSGISRGPLLFLKLRPGTYRIDAEINGVWQSQRVRAGASGPAAQMRFVARGD